MNRNARTLRRHADVPGETEIARTARLIAKDALKRIDQYAERLEKWWNAQLPRTRAGLAIIAVVVVASLLNVVEMQVARGTPGQTAAAQGSAIASALRSEAAPVDTGKMWSVVKIWQGSGSHDTERFTVADHWRVDWLFHQTQSVGDLQVYVYGTDGRLLNVAGNIARAGSDTTFWMGPGTYYLKVMSNGGDWKVDVQDLH